LIVHFILQSFKFSYNYINIEGVILRVIILIFPVIFLLFSTSCSKKEKIKINQFYEKKAIVTTLKSSKFKYSDTGFISKGKRKTKIEVLAMGTPALVLEFTKDRVCVNKKCLTYNDFNKEFLSQYYPEKIIQDLFFMRPIFKGRNIKSNKSGFTQIIEKPDIYQISYRVSTFDKQIVFRDSLNKVLIKIREI
jgi:hypothetical protein